MSRDRPSGRRWLKISHGVIRRDRGICWRCKRPNADTTDHVVPISKGGAWYDPRNLRACCRSCNSRAGNQGIPTPNPSRAW